MYKQEMQSNNIIKEDKPLHSIFELIDAAMPFIEFQKFPANKHISLEQDDEWRTGSDINSSPTIVSRCGTTSSVAAKESRLPTRQPAKRSLPFWILASRVGKASVTQVSMLVWIAGHCTRYKKGNITA